MECNGCTLCCKVFAVEALAKPLGTPCVFQREGCCAVYSTRPNECATFQCVYLSTGLAFLNPRRLGAAMAVFDGLLRVNCDEGVSIDNLPKQVLDWLKTTGYKVIIRSLDGEETEL